MTLMRTGCFIAWLRDHGVVFFRVVDDHLNHVDVEFIQLQWASNDAAQNHRRIFEDPQALRHSVMLSTTWWPHVEKLSIAEAPATSIRYDQLGWWTPQTWMQEKLPKS